jgi:hypothetical protein
MRQNRGSGSVKCITKYFVQNIGESPVDDADQELCTLEGDV